MIDQKHLKNSIGQKIRSQSFGVYLSCFIVVSFLLLLIEDYWIYFIVLFCYLLLLIVGLFIKSFRIFTLLLFGILIVSQSQRFHWFSEVKLTACENQPEQVFGTINYVHENYLLLQNLEVYCHDQVYKIHSAKLLYETDKQQQKLVKKHVSQQIELRDVSIQKNNFLNYQIQLKKHSPIFNHDSLLQLFQRTSLRTKLLNKAQYYLSGDALALFQSLFLYERYGLSKDNRDKIISLGIWHLFAISGLHVGLLFLFSHSFFRVIFYFLNRKRLFGQSIIISDFVACIVLFFYLQIIGFPITAIRAWCMICFWVCSRYVFQWIPTLTILLIIACLFLAFDPYVIRDLSFQISFFVTFIILITNHFLFFPQNRVSIYKKIVFFFYNQVFITSMIFFGILIIQIGIFKFVTLASILNNIIHINYVSWIFLPIGFIIIFLSLLGLYIDLQNLELIGFKIMQTLGDFWLKLVDVNYQFSSHFHISIKSPSLLLLSIFTFLLGYIYLKILLHYDRKKTFKR